MELEYRENIDYDVEAEKSIDDMLEELIELTGLDVDVSELYEAIHSKIVREIKYNELGITRIMPDLIDMAETMPKKAKLCMKLLADPYASYSSLGKEMGISKQRVQVVLCDLARRYEWLARLLLLHNGKD